MSWSLIEPEEPLGCECKYDAERDEMDREDCPFHCDAVEDASQPEAPVVRKAFARGARPQEDAA